MSGRRLRILVLVDTLNPGGAERAAVGLATNMPRDRYDVTVCATRSNDGYLRDQLDEAAVPYVCLERSGRVDVAPFVRLRRLLREGHFEVLHAHKFGSNLWGSIVGRLAGTPVVVAHEHSWSYEGQPLRRLLDGRVIGRLADVMVAVSRADRERMTSVEGIPAERTVYIPNAFLPRALAPTGGDLRAQLGIPPSAPVVGTVAVLRAEKRLDVLIDAFAALSDRVPDARLVVAGHGPARAGWERQAESLGLADRVHWLGMRDDLDVVMRAFDVAALSSEREGMPLFAFECMASRTPLVASAVGGLPDVLEDGVSALLVPPAHAGALADGLATLLAAPDRRRGLADAAHARLDEYSVERAVERIGALYDELLERRGVRERAPATPLSGVS